MASGVDVAEDIQEFPTLETVAALKKAAELSQSPAPDSHPCGGRPGRVAHYITGLPSGPFTSAFQAARTASCTDFGSGMYSSSSASLSPLL